MWDVAMTCALLIYYFNIYSLPYSIAVLIEMQVFQFWSQQKLSDREQNNVVRRGWKSCT